MAAPSAQAERRALIGSIAVTAAFGLLGVGWGITSGSQMILFDGIYGLVGIITSWLLLRASALAAIGPTPRYRYGREGATPLVIAVQGFVLLATLLYASVEAVYVIRDGGSEVTAGWAIVYAVLTTAASLATWWWLRGRVPGSDVIRSESVAWRVAAWRGAGMVVGFGTMAILADGRWDAWVPYIDPVMVLVMCALFLAAPIRLIRATIVELLEGLPGPEVQRSVLDAVVQVSHTFDFPEPEVRMTKLGPKLYVEVDAVARATTTVAETDEVRAALAELLDDLPFDVWLNLEFRAIVS